MNYVSVCSGIESATVAWHPLGWRPLAFAEIAAFPSRVLAHHYPTVPNVGDFTSMVAPAGALVTCSSAVLRAKISALPDSEQGFQELAATSPWSSAASLIAFGRAGYSGKTSPEFCPPTADGTLAPSSGRWANSGMGSRGELWTLSSSECPSDGEESSLSDILEIGDVPPQFFLSARACAGILRRAEARGIKLPPPAACGVAGDVAHTLRAEGFDASEDGTGRGTPVVAFRGPPISVEHAGQILDANTRAIAFAENSRGEVRLTGDVTGALSAGGGKPGQGPAIAFHASQDPISGAVTPALSANATFGVTVANTVTCHQAKGGDPSTDNYTVDSLRVRRLTPRECERLQGFPDDYTAIPGATSAARYHALGNSMAVPCMRWIGKRIAFVDSLG